MLTPHALISTEALQARLKRSQSGEDDLEQRLIDAVNAATGWLESATVRPLRARNYRTSYTALCLAGGASTALSTASTSAMEAGDDVRGSNLQAGTQIASITDASNIVLNRKTTAAFGYTSLTFGSAPMAVSGDGTSEIYASEFPLVELFSAYVVESDGTRTALDITDARYERETGRIRLLNDVFPKGSLNIDLECRAGYEPPSATSLGSPDWFALEALAFRVAEVCFSDALTLRGRATDASVGGLSASFGDASMPADIIAAAHRFRRMWS